MSELKPCPFCGGRADIEEIPVVNGVAFSAGCNSENEDETGLCMGYQHTASFSRRSEAIEAWNRRADTPDLLRGARIGLEMAAKECDARAAAYRAVGFVGQNQQSMNNMCQWVQEAVGCAMDIRAISDADIMKEISRE